MITLDVGDKRINLALLPKETTTVAVYFTDEKLVYLHYNFVPKNGKVWYHKLALDKDVWSNDDLAIEILGKEIQYWIDYANKQIDEGAVT